MDDLRQNIIQINSRTDIDQTEKSKLIFELMNKNNTVKTEERSDNEIMECPHYQRKCLLECHQCNKFYPCRVCHDDNEDHEMNRHEVKKIKCKECLTIQEPNKFCINTDCKIEFAHYFCAICNLYVDDKEKIITHCDKCGICRVGKVKHCDICDMCYNEETFDNHICNVKFDYQCAICGEELKASRDPVTTLPCKHIIHSKCLQQNLINGNYQCPLCKKSVTDMSNFWLQIDTYVQNSTMPVEYQDMKAEISCNDCDVKSITKFHFMYHKCSGCNGYNTNILRTFKDE